MPLHYLGLHHKLLWNILKHPLEWYKGFANGTFTNRIERRKAIVKNEINQAVRNAFVKGYHIAGKTGTSEKNTRNTNKYIASFVGFAPADDPQVLALCIINHPQGVYYGGTIAAPVIQRVFANILPYLGMEADTVQLETEKDWRMREKELY